jgi:hypothetical protein
MRQNKEWKGVGSGREGGQGTVTLSRGNGAGVCSRVGNH